MNYIKHLTGFFNQIALEQSLNTTHISLYMTLFQCWNINRFKNPININRDEMMKGSKIASTATYHKCIKKLEDLGFLQYFPSYNPHAGTLIYMNNLAEGLTQKIGVLEPSLVNNEQLSIQKPAVKASKFGLTTPSNEQALDQKSLKSGSKLDRTLSKNEQLNEQVVEQVNDQLYIYNNKTNTNKINKTNKIYIEPENDFLNFNSPLKKNEIQFESQKKIQTETSLQKLENEIPSAQTVKEYFKFQENTEFEAERFFNYYSSNGWLIGGKTTMKDWKASARNWMLNTAKFTVNSPKTSSGTDQTRVQYLHANTDKNYAEPL